jgi:hypothetical protein
MKFVFSTTLALALLTSAPALAEDKIDVMTQNQYLGADLSPIIAALSENPPNLPAANEAIITALEDAVANDYPERSKKLAELIADRLPELVGLQEMFAFTCVDIDGECTDDSDCAPYPCLGGSFCWAPPTEGEGCDDPRIADAFNNHLDATLSELFALGETYLAPAVVENLNVTLPVDLSVLPDGLPDILVNVLDRDVILAREDIAGDVTPLDDVFEQVLPLSQLCPARFPPSPGDPPNRTSGNGCNYNVVAAAGPITIERGWVGVDYVDDEGTTYRVVDTHLEVQFLLGNPGTGDVPLGFIQAAQAAELVGVLDTLRFPEAPEFDHLIIVGDINSGPRDETFEDPFAPNPPFPQGLLFHPPYMQLASGVGLFVGDSPSPLGPLTDAWDLRPGAVPGYTCCQDDDLLNHHSELGERIDVIFSLEEPSKVKKARVLGSKVSDKTAPPADGGLWPSDHGSVAAELQFDE